MARLAVRIVPCGDRLQGAPPEATPILRTTDAAGRCSFPFPDWTHVRVEARGLELGEGRLLPDYTKRQVLRATPFDTTSVRIWALAGGSSMPKSLVARDALSRRRVALLQRVRVLGVRDAIYLASWDPADGPLPRWRQRVDVTLEGLGGRRFPVSLDLSGGASETLHILQ